MSRFLCLSISGLLEPAGCALAVADLHVETRTPAPIIPFAPSQCCYERMMLKNAEIPASSFDKLRMR